MPHDHLIARLEHGQPRLARVHGDAEVARQRCEVEQASAACGEEAQELGTRYNIRSIPTLALFVGGREIARQAGAMDVGGIVRWARSKV